MSNIFDLNDAEKQRDRTLIPPGVYRLQTKARPGGAGPGSVLRLAKNGRTLMLDLELKIVGGECAGKRLWDLITVAVEPPEFEDANVAEREQTERYQTAARIGRSKLRAMLESAYAIDPDDDSEAAQNKRRFEDFLELDGLEFWAQVEIKKGTNGYKDKNILDFVVTPNLPDWPRQANPPSKAVASRARDLDDAIPFEQPTVSAPPIHRRRRFHGGATMLDHSCQVQRHALSERGDDLYETPPVAVEVCCGSRISAPAVGAGGRARSHRQRLARPRPRGGRHRSCRLRVPDHAPRLLPVSF